MNLALIILEGMMFVLQTQARRNIQADCHFQTESSVDKIILGR